MLDREPTLERPVSQLCTFSQFSSPVYDELCCALNEPPRMTRKLWEFIYITQVLRLKGMLQPGRAALGFGVGREPLPSLFARYGCHVLATDMGYEAASQEGWVDSGQHCSDLSALNERGLCDPAAFAERVQFRVADMNSIDQDLRQGAFDFVWSSCAAEHLGSLAHGLEFIFSSLDCVRPGGVAVHTTEYTVSSNTRTVFEGNLVFYRKRDIEAFVKRTRRAGHRIRFNSCMGHSGFDYGFDAPPYREHFQLRLLVGDFVITSLGLIIQKAGR